MSSVIVAEAWPSIARTLFTFAPAEIASDGATYDCLALTIEGDPEDFRSREYERYPKVKAAVPLTDGGTVKVYGEASR